MIALWGLIALWLVFGLTSCNTLGVIRDTPESTWIVVEGLVIDLGSALWDDFKAIVAVFGLFL
jgi:hypothetical protein